MKVVVLGGGVLGITTAYYCARAGHEVRVLERQPGPALETSYANAGEISPGYAAPWAAPGIPLKAIKWMFQKHAPLVIWPRLDPAMWRWGLMMLANCTAARYELNKGRMLPLAAYSRDTLRELRRETKIQYDERSLGTLQMFRTQKQLDGAARDIEILKRYGVPYEVLDVAGCVAAEPALARVREKIAGGLRLPGDETGDCFKFTDALADLAKKQGVDMKFGVSITAIAAEGDRVTGIETDQGRIVADRYVLALGSYSPLLLKPIAIDLPVYPVKGYSITVPITDAGAAPVSTVMDETYKVAVTRLGDRIRAAGTAELAGYNLKLRESRLDTIKHVVRDLFAAGGDLARAEGWCGLRPMTPDGTPVVGETRYRNLLLNTGHGTLGWTMGCGSGRVIADLICGRKPEISTEGLGLERYR